MDRESFEKLVIYAIKEIPAKFRHNLKNIDIVVEDRPSEELLKECKIDPKSLLLGLYQGVPVTKRGFYYTNVLPDRITIFQENVEKAAGSEARILETLKKVIVHEIGHYYGLGEKDM